MKKFYEIPAIEIYKLSLSDVMTVSDEFGAGDDIPTKPGDDDELPIM